MIVRTSKLLNFDKSWRFKSPVQSRTALSVIFMV